MGDTAQEGWSFCFVGFFFFTRVLFCLVAPVSAGSVTGQVRRQVRGSGRLRSGLPSAQAPLPCTASGHVPGGSGILPDPVAGEAICQQRIDCVRFSDEKTVSEQPWSGLPEVWGCPQAPCFPQAGLEPRLGKEMCRFKADQSRGGWPACHWALALAAAAPSLLFPSILIHLTGDGCGDPAVPALGL